MKINEYPIGISHLSRSYLDEWCRELVRKYSYDAYYRDRYQKHIAWLACSDDIGLYFGSLGVEFGRVNGEILTGPYGHFNTQGVNLNHFTNSKFYIFGSDRPDVLKHHPSIYARVEKLRKKCEFINIHIKDYHGFH